MKQIGALFGCARPPGSRARAKNKSRPGPPAGKTPGRGAAGGGLAAAGARPEPRSPPRGDNGPPAAAPAEIGLDGHQEIPPTDICPCAPAPAAADGSLLAAQPPDVLGALRELRGRLGPSEPHVTDLFLLQFLLAKGTTVDCALELVRQRLQWEKEVGLEQIVLEGPLQELARIKQCYPHGWHGVDRQGRPVYIERLGQLDICALMAFTTPEQLLRNFIRQSEVLVRERFPACTVLAGRLVRQSLNIVDLDGLSFRVASDPRVKAYVKEIASLGQKKYPDVMGMTVIVNAPRVFAAAWQAIKPHLDAGTRGRIRIIGPDRRQVRRQLLELIEPHELPEFLGGECRCSGVPGGCLLSDRGPWRDGPAARRAGQLPYYELLQRAAEGRCEGLARDEPAAGSSRGTPPAERAPQQRAGRASAGACAGAKGELQHEAVLERRAPHPPAAPPDVPQRGAGPALDEAERICDLCDALNDLERAHMRSLESWLLEAQAWERKLTFQCIVAAAPFHESEQRAHVARQRLQGAQARCLELKSTCDDHAQAVDAAKGRLDILARGRHEAQLPELPRSARADACARLQHDVECAASAELQLDMWKEECEKLAAALELAESAHAELTQKFNCSISKLESIRLSRPYFNAKLKHETRIQEEVTKLSVLNTELQEILAQSDDAVAPDRKLSLSDFEVAAVDANSAPAEAEAKGPPAGHRDLA